jgi:hypothetical protein
VLVLKVFYFNLGEGDLPDGICKPPEELAELIEDVIFRVHRGTTPKYKNQVKQSSSEDFFQHICSLFLHCYIFIFTMK